MNQITKDQFLAVLDAAGVTADQKRSLHAAFERRHPEAHQGFLEFLGVPSAEIERIRRQSREG